jgi:hypothetical protein
MQTDAGYWLLDPGETKNSLSYPASLPAPPTADLRLLTKSSGRDKRTRWRTGVLDADNEDYHTVLEIIFIQ